MDFARLFSAAEDVLKLDNHGPYNPLSLIPKYTNDEIWEACHFLERMGYIRIKNRDKSPTNINPK